MTEKTHINFADFLDKCFAHLNPSVKSYRRWYVELLIRYAEAIGDESLKRLIVNLPPRHLKSQIFSIALPCWTFGIDPSKKILIVSHSSHSVSNIMMCISHVMKSGWYSNIFPHLKTISANKRKITSSKMGSICATSFKGSIFGEGADLIVVDDPISAASLTSSRKLKECNHLFEIGICSRLNNAVRGQILIIMQRLHVLDLTGNILKNAKDDWLQVSIPSIELKDTKYSFRDFSYRRTIGEVLDSIRSSKQTLRQIEKLIGTANFQAQYQQQPIPVSNLLKLEWFGIKQCEHDKDHIKISSWDTATSLNGDFSSCINVCLQNEQHFVQEVIRGKWEYPQLKQQMIRVTENFMPDYVLIENKNSGQQLAQELRHLRDIKIVSINPTINKVERLMAALPTIEKNNIFLPTFESGWAVEFLNEVLSFPDGEYDDQVDAFIQYINWFRRTIQNSNRQTIRFFGI